MGIDPGVSRLGGEIVSHNTTDGSGSGRTIYPSRFQFTEPGPKLNQFWVTELDSGNQTEIDCNFKNNENRTKTEI